MEEKQLRVEVIGNIDLTLITNTFYQMLLEDMLALQKQKEKS